VCADACVRRRSEISRIETFKIFVSQLGSRLHLAIFGHDCSINVLGCGVHVAYNLTDASNQAIHVALPRLLLERSHARRLEQPLVQGWQRVTERVPNVVGQLDVLRAAAQKVATEVNRLEVPVCGKVCRDVCMTVCVRVCACVCVCEWVCVWGGGGGEQARVRVALFFY
jgi:hypothetical protein